MIAALLLDLDGTLIDNDMEQFIPTYLDMLSEFTSALVPPEEFTRTLLESTMVMSQNDDPEITLEQAFSNRFFPALGVPEDELRQMIEDFYAHRFPDLRPLVQIRPQAKSLIEEALLRGMEVVVATNPLFPLTAITQRLTWGDISADDHAYTLITSFEDFRFCKPNSAYYAEILGRLGHRAHEVVMVGNEPKNDLVPARALGIPVFHIDAQPAEPYAGGNLEEVLPWVDGEATREADVGATSQPISVLARLKGHLAAFLGMVSDLDLPAWTRCPRAGEWSPVEIICHLRDVEIEVNQPRIEAVLDQRNPFVHAADPDAWAQTRAYALQEPLEALRMFTVARKQTIARLQALEPGDWLRPARHALIGPTTLSEIAAIATDHDLLHLAQLRECLCARS
ncbi:MAG TPA: HAD hydrolase-like protein [Anaerolineae bacterium]|nr:HAD hydrolase-like protein [Anaerolineae bacterium]